MNRDLTADEIERYADDEVDPAEAGEMEQHLLQCSRCASAVLRIVQMKRAVRDAMSEEGAPAALRGRVRRQIGPSKAPSAWWLLAAAVVVAVVAAMIVPPPRPSPALPELVDMHTTLLASANPVDVVSTDRHTVKPWFEGKLPFTVPVPDLSPTPFRLIGGRVVYWRGNPGAYLLIGKGAHRLSLFIFRDDMAPRDLAGGPLPMTTNVWRSRGLTFIAVAQVPPEDVRQLRAALESSR